MRNTERVGGLFRNGCSVRSFCKHSHSTAVRLGTIRHYVDDCLLGHRATPDRRSDGLRECQRCPRDAHLRLHDTDLRPVRYSLPSRSHVAGLVEERSPEVARQRFQGEPEGARAASSSRVRPPSSLRVQVRVGRYERGCSKRIE